MAVIYRKAVKEDIAQISEYINLASDGMLDLLFSGNSSDMTVFQILSYSLNDEEGRDSFKNVIIAEQDREIIGITQFYNSEFHCLDDNMKTFLSKDKVELFSSFYQTRIDNSLVINAIFVDERYRRRGIGTDLINLSKEKAKSIALNKLSLYVHSDNKPAQNLYLSNGFIKSRGIRIHCEDEIYLMCCNL